MKKPRDFSPLQKALLVLIPLMMLTLMNPAPALSQSNISRTRTFLQNNLKAGANPEIARLAQAFLLVQDDAYIRSSLATYYNSHGENLQALKLIKSSRTGYAGKAWLLIRIKSTLWLILISAFLLYLAATMYMDRNNPQP